MKLESLKILRCPYCAGELNLESSPPPQLESEELTTGTLSCSCCAYPVVAGIPYLRTGQTATSVLKLLNSRQAVEALFVLLGLDESRRQKFQRLLDSGQRATYRSALETLSPNLEGTYFLYRFSDPTFLVSEAVLRSLGQATDCANGPVLDMCGGSGHLTRTLLKLPRATEGWLADFEFWKIWLAKRFVAPECQVVCCDANQPLPFARESFSLVVCTDALHYIWQRRLFAGEMLRLVGDRGVVAVTHTHNVLCENPSQGMPLDPAGYRRLFESVSPRIFKESTILDCIRTGQPVSLSANFSDEELNSEPALIIIATAASELFRDYVLPPNPQQTGKLAINPLYQAEPRGNAVTLSLRFPSDYYAAEFAECKRYLPERVELSAENLANLEKPDAPTVDTHLGELARRHVLLALPEHFF